MIDPPPAPRTPQAIREELEFLRRAVASLARGRAGADLEDVVSEAWIRWDRARRRETPRNPEAFMNHVAKCSWIDHVRRLRSRGQQISIDEHGDTIAEPEIAEESVDPVALATIRFAILEHFSRVSPRCHELTRQRLADLGWAEVAAREGVKPNTIAQQWTRCMQRIRDLLSEDTGMLGELHERLFEALT